MVFGESQSEIELSKSISPINNLHQYLATDPQAVGDKILFLICQVFLDC